MSKRLTLILGGIRAGKSSYAQQLATAGERVLFHAGSGGVGGRSGHALDRVQQGPFDPRRA